VISGIVSDRVPIFGGFRQEWCQMQTVSLEIGRIGKHGFRSDWLSVVFTEIHFFIDSIKSLTEDVNTPKDF